jgi:Na+/phosphate symporter
MKEGEILDLTEEDDILKIPIEQHTEILNSATKEVGILIENVNGFFQEFSEYSKKRIMQQKKIIAEYERQCDDLDKYIDHIHAEILTFVDGK